MAQTKNDAPVQARAKAKYVRSTPRKAQLVAEQIRGLPVPEARTVLAFSKRAAARDIEKVLSSAVANAESNHDLIGDECFVREVYVGQGPVLKRWRARARGRVGRIHKRTCHIVVGLAELDEELRALYAQPVDEEAAVAEPDQADTETDEATPSEDAATDDAEDKAEESEDTDAAADESVEAAAEDVDTDSADPADAAEPYAGYADHTAKEVIKEVSELTDEQLAAVAAQDTRVTVLRATEKEQARRAEATDEDQEG